jgi:hypothetical protein
MIGSIRTTELISANCSVGSTKAGWHGSEPCHRTQCLSWMSLMQSTNRDRVRRWKTTGLA